MILVQVYQQLSLEEAAFYLQTRSMMSQLGGRLEHWDGTLNLLAGAQVETVRRSWRYQSHGSLTRAGLHPLLPDIAVGIAASPALCPLPNGRLVCLFDVSSGHVPRLSRCSYHFHKLHSNSRRAERSKTTLDWKPSRFACDYPQPRRFDTL